MLRKKAQSSLEYAGLVIIVLGVLIGIGVYFKRGVQGRWKAAVDEMGEQYDPAYMDTMVTHTLASNTEMRITTVPRAGGGFWSLREDQVNAAEMEWGTERVGSAP